MSWAVGGNVLDPREPVDVRIDRLPEDTGHPHVALKVLPGVSVK